MPLLLEETLPYGEDESLWYFCHQADHTYCGQIRKQFLYLQRLFNMRRSEPYYGLQIPVITIVCDLPQAILSINIESKEVTFCGDLCVFKAGMPNCPYLPIYKCMNWKVNELKNIPICTPRINLALIGNSNREEHSSTH